MNKNKIIADDKAKSFLVESEKSTKKIRSLDPSPSSRFVFYQFTLPAIFNQNNINAIDSPIFNKNTDDGDTTASHYFKILLFLIKANNFCRIYPKQCGWFFDEKNKTLTDFNERALKYDPLIVTGYCRQIENQTNLSIPVSISELALSFFSFYKETPTKDDIEVSLIPTLF